MIIFGAMRANYKNADLFEFKFGRKCKVWTIEQLHDLWIKAKERTQKRKQLLSDCIRDIVENITPDKDGVRKVYHTGQHGVIQVSFKYNKYYKSQGFSSEILKKNTREDRLEFLLANEIAFQKGEAFNKIYVLQTYLDSVIKEIMWDDINVKLAEKIDGYSTNIILKIRISDREYYVMTTDNGYHKSFTLLNEAIQNDIITVS